MTLLPCPFCGDTEPEIVRYGDHRQSTQYQCTNCGCFLETGEQWDHGARWNRRTTPANVAELQELLAQWRKDDNLAAAILTAEVIRLMNDKTAIQLATISKIAEALRVKADQAPDYVGTIWTGDEKQQWLDAASFIESLDINTLQQTKQEDDLWELFADGHRHLAKQCRDMAAQLKSVYRERAHLVAFLARQFPFYISVDDAEPDWPVVIIETPKGQMSWHIDRDDLDLFNGTNIEADSSVVWDGHTTDEKYERLQALTQDAPLTFDMLRRAHDLRDASTFKHYDLWTPTDWGCALAGEVGELCNKIKKLHLDAENRGKDVTLDDVAEELADVVLYVDLLAAVYKVRLSEAVRKKFNIVSERYGARERL